MAQQRSSHRRPVRREKSAKTKTTSTRARSRRRGARGGPSRRTLWKALAALGLLVLIVSGGALVHYYSIFNRLVDTRLAEAASVAPAVYARPIELRAGEPALPGAWKWRLEAAGYKVEAKDGPPAHELQILGPGDSSPFHLVFQAGRLTSIFNGERRLEQLTLGPAFLSSIASSKMEKSRHLRLSQFPDLLKEAVLAAEDQRFFFHPGVDPLTLLRAILRNLWYWELEHGGSTLTQQLVKNYFLNPEKRVRRKLEEMVFAIMLEQRFSKDEILELYLNKIYLGQMGGFAIHGFGQASLSYFGKDLETLDLSETAALVGMLPAPNRYSPYRNPEAVLARRGYVLDRMETEGYITARQNAETRSLDLEFRPASFQESSQAPYFVDLVGYLLHRDYGLDPAYAPGVEVYSTLDPGLQHLAFQAVRDGLNQVDALLEKRKKRPVPQAALIALDPSSGEVVALVGGRDYADGPFNRAVYAFRQPGSAMKPFVLAAALQESQAEGRIALTLGSQILDEPYTFRYDGQTYSPGNYGNHYHGLVSLRSALALSLNVPTVKLAEIVGFPRLLERYRKFDMGERWKAYPSLALGTFEVSLLHLAQAYQTLANQGRLLPLRATRRVVAGGKTISEPARAPRQVLDPGVAFLVVSALQSVMDEGTGNSVRRLGFTLPAAGKTGTTDDSWFIGFTPELLCAVWVGTDGSPPLELDGSRAALPIWTRFMQGARGAGYLSGKPFPIPSSVERVSIDEETGLRATPQCAKVRDEFFLIGTAPEFYCHGVQNRVELTKPEREKRKGFLGWLGRVFAGRKP